MSTDKRTECERLADAARFDGFVRDGIPEELERHADTCERCSRQVATLARLRASLDALGQRSAEKAQGLDIQARVMAAASETSPAPASRWVWRLAPIALAAVVLLALWPRPSRSGFLVRGEHATLHQGGKTRELGARKRVDAPFALSTESGARAWVAAQEGEYALQENSEIELRKGAPLSLKRGVVELVSAEPVRLEVRGMVIEGQGEFHVETLGEGTRDMKILKKHKVIAGSAVVALAVYGGWATLSTADSKVEVKAPGGVHIDDKGDAHRFGVRAGDGSSGDVVALARAGAEGEEARGSAAKSGSYWNEAAQVVAFRVEGEALDIDTGMPVDALEIVAHPVDSQDYGQAKPKTFALAGLSEGRFTLEGMGRGEWEITGHAEGYAPVTQRVDLRALDADPYVVVPFSEGAQWSGQVIDWKGEPVSGAKVGLVECIEASAKGPHCKIVESDKEGRFALPALPDEGVFAVRAEHDKYGVATVHNLKQEAGAGRHIVIPLSGVVRIFGEVTRGKKQAVVAGATVVSGSGSTKSDQNGVYELFVPLEDRPEAFVDSFPNGPQGRARVTSHPDGRSAREVRWVHASTHVAEVRIDFRLQMDEARLFGKVVDKSGAPVPGLELRLANTAGWAQDRGHETFPTAATTDAQGRYSVENIPSEAGYRIQYRPEGKDEMPWELLGYVNIPREEPVEANFQLGGATLRGRFVDASGEPVSVSDRGCMRLGAKHKEGGAETFYLPHCYGDGRFEFSDLPGGSYSLVNRLEWMSSPLKIHAQELTVAAGAIREGVEVEVEGEASIRFKLRVLDQDGRFLTGAFLRYHDGGTSFTEGVNPGDDGSSEHSLSRRYTSFFIDCPGHESRELPLLDIKDGQLVQVRLAKKSGKPMDE